MSNDTASNDTASTDTAGTRDFALEFASTLGYVTPQASR